MAKAKGSSFEKLTPILVLVSIAMAFAVGVLWQKVENLSGGGTRVTTTNNQPQDPSAAGVQAPAPQGPAQGKLSEDQVARIPEVSSADHIRGNANAKITLIEYSDYECPFCSRFHPTTKQVLDEYDGEVRLVYRHFPLDSLHPRARSAAVASECVAELGGDEAFWSFTDEIFASQSTTLGDLAGTAASVGVSESGVQNCIDSGKYDDLVEDQYQGGLAAGITGTPGNFIVNDSGEAWLIPGALPFEQVKATIDTAMGS